MPPPVDAAEARIAPVSHDVSLAYDPLDLDGDPYATYRRLRNEAPAYAGSTAGVPFVALSRYDDVKAAAGDWRTFSSAFGNDLDDTGTLFGPAPAMDLSDPPVHTRQRTALRSAFSPQVINDKLHPIARRAVADLLRQLRERDTFDVARDLAYPLPARVMCEWLGFPEADWARLRQWHETMLERDAGQIVLPRQAMEARDELWSYIRDALAERRLRERDDLLSALSRAHLAGSLSEEEAMANALFFFDAGIVSTSALIGSAFLHLERRRAGREELRRSPGIIPLAVNELLRFDAPFQWFTRVAMRDVELHGVEVPKGMRVVLIWASANRDERQWDAADELIFARPPQRHLSFSAGVHQCLGEPIARAEVAMLLEAMMPRIVDYELTGPIARRITPSERTIARMPARVRWAGD